MVHVGTMTGLALLDISGTAVTDKGLQELSDLELLRSLDVSKTKVTAKGRDALQASLPEVKIEK